MNINNPFDVLQDLERRTLKGATGLPALDRIEEEWVGVGFRVGDAKLIASMADVKEILELPEYTYVPGVKSWIVGIANVRGSLLPIMDMKGFLLGDDIKQRHKGRVIVIDCKGFNTGLIVDEIFGMRHFRESDETEDFPEMHESISPYVERAYKQGDEHWPVFSFNEMAEDERFAHASL
ncbi:MAG: purine-binding chemotaxis protein CheW [Gammaproteobacteria bacterium]|nr:purine-binding chemotaxis protein CheW [Gammaproteobacteria bacterium]